MKRPKPLTETNPYLRDPEKRRRMLEKNARESCIFERAEGLRPIDQAELEERLRRIESAKKSAKGA